MKPYIKLTLILVMSILAVLLGITPVAAASTTPDIGVAYRGHVQNQGDMPKPVGTMVNGPEALGTRGQSLRVEGFWIDLTGDDLPADASISYQVHVQNVGWMSAESDGDFAGTKGASQRIEAIKINLINLPGYDVYYRGHVQNRGDIPQIDGDWGWVKNGAELGTTGSSLRLEELQVKIVKQDVAITDDVIYSKAGTYGPSTGTNTIASDVEITKSGVILQNLIINGDLTIGEGVGEGDATLNNITVKGDTYIKGGGANSIHINGGTYNNITVMQTESGQTRIVATGSNNLEVVISEDATGEDIILEGNFDKVSVNAPNVVINTQGDTKINSFDVGSKSTGSDIKTKEGTTINSLKIAAPIAVTGAGAIANAEVKSNGVSFETAPTKQTVDPAVTTPPVITPPVVDPIKPPVTPPVTPTPGGGGGGIQTPTTTAITFLGITGNCNVGDTMGTLPQPTTATGTYQWYRSDKTFDVDETGTGTYTAISGATSKTYIPTIDDANKWLKVSMTGTGSYSGTKISVAVNIMNQKDLTDFTELPDLNLNTDEHIADLTDLIASGKLPTEFNVTDGTDTITVPIVDWYGDYSGTNMEPQPIRATWECPSEYRSFIENIDPIVTVHVNTAQTKVVSTQKELLSTGYGTISEQSVIDVPRYTLISIFKSVLKASLHATVEILDSAGGTPVANQNDTVVTADMVVRVTAEDNSTKVYNITLADDTAPQVGRVEGVTFEPNGGDVLLKMNEPADMTGITGFDVVLSTDGQSWSHQQTVQVDDNYTADKLYVPMSPVAAMINTTTHYTHAKIISRPAGGFTANELTTTIDFTVTITNSPLTITPVRQLDGTVDIGLPADKDVDQTYLCRIFDADKNNILTQVIASSNESFWKDARTITLPESSVPTTDLLIDVVRITNGTSQGITASGVTADGTAVTPGDGSTTPFAITYLTLIGDNNVGSILSVSPTPTNATGTYQWYRSASANGTFAAISGATTKTYTLQNADENMVIKCVVIGTGFYSGTKSSIVTPTVTNLKELVSGIGLDAITLDSDEHITTLAKLIDSGKLPTVFDVTDGETTETATIDDWTGTFEGTDTVILIAQWTAPDGYCDLVSPIIQTIEINVDVAQTLQGLAVPVT